MCVRGESVNGGASVGEVVEGENEFEGSGESVSIWGENVGGYVRVSVYVSEYWGCKKVGIEG